MSIEYPDLQPFYRHIFNNTIADLSIEKDVQFARLFIEEWSGNFLHPFGDDLHRAGKLENIFYSYLSSQSNVFDWLCHSLLFGHYQTVLRELRTILENMFYMFYLDVTYQNNTVEEKLQIIKDQENIGRTPHGKTVFKKSTYKDWQLSYELYKELCAYIHIHSTSSAKLAMEIAKKGFPELLSMKYNKEDFLKCIFMWKNIAKISLRLVDDMYNKLDVQKHELNITYLDDIWK